MTVSIAAGGFETITLYDVRKEKRLRVGVESDSAFIEVTLTTSSASELRDALDRWIETGSVEE